MIPLLERSATSLESLFLRDDHMLDEAPTPCVDTALDVELPKLRDVHICDLGWSHCSSKHKHIHFMLTITGLSSDALVRFLNKHRQLKTLELHDVRWTASTSWIDIFHALHRHNKRRRRDNRLFILCDCVPSPQRENLFHSLYSDEPDCSLPGQALHNYVHGEGGWTPQLAEEWSGS